MDFTNNQYDQDDSEFDPRSDGNSMREDDSDGSQVRHKSKKKGSSSGLGAYNMLKILNVILYISTVQQSLGYFTTTKFTSKFVYYAFGGLLITRPILIALYSLINLCLEFRKGTPGKKKDKKKGRKGGDMDDFSESQRSYGDEDDEPSYMEEPHQYRKN